MTIVVGWSPYHRDAGAVELAAAVAAASGEPVRAVSIVPEGWPTSVAQNTEREFEAAAADEGERAATAARRILDAAGVEGTSVWVPARSVPQALLAQCESNTASVLVLGSGEDGAMGRITLTSKTDRILHSSPVPVAVAPRGFRAAAAGTLIRLTCAFRDTEASAGVVARAGELCARIGARLRIVTFGVYPRRMYPSEVGNVERMVVDAWLEQAAAAQQRLVGELARAGGLPEGTTTGTAVGRSWWDAIDSIDWRDGDLLVVGSSSTHALAQVFLGSSAAKIVRNAPVPVVVVP